MTASFDYHIMWRDRVVDRATSERVALTVCANRDEILGREFGVDGYCRVLRVVHVPTGEVVARHYDNHFLPPRKP